MADDPRKKGADGKRVSQQPHEQKYQRRKQRTSGGSGESTESSSSKDSSSMERSRSGNRSESTGRSGSNGGR
jgi:hypothetical protein